MGAYPTAGNAGAPVGPLVTFRTQNILPPGAVYVTPNDSLELIGRAPTVSTQVTLTVRILTPQGIVTNIVNSYTISTVGTATQSNIINPTEGFILSAQLVANNTSRGQCFVRLQLHQNPRGGDPTLGALLFQGYVSADDHLSYPQSPTESSLDGRGYIHSLAMQVISGNTLQLVVPAGVRWASRTTSVQCTTSAVVANRRVQFTIQDPSGNLLVQVLNGTNIPASTFAEVNWGDGLNTGLDLTAQSVASPRDLVLPAGYVVKISGVTFQAGDSLAGFMLLEEWVAQ